MNKIEIHEVSENGFSIYLDKFSPAPWVISFKKNQHLKIDLELLLNTVYAKGREDKAREIAHVLNPHT